MTPTGLDALKVSPAYGFDNVPNLIYIHGHLDSHFTRPLTVMLGSELLEVSYVESALIAAVVPDRLPVGMYNVTVQYGSDQSETMVNAYEVLDADVVNDLLSSDEWMWSDPFPLRVGYTGSSVGLLVQHLGGRETIDEVTVEFRQDTITGTLIGQSLTNVLAPFATEATGPVTWEPEQAGEHTICAIIDPQNKIRESNEENNTVCQTLTVQPSHLDVMPPEVQENSFLIADNAPTTEQITVTLAASAIDYPNIGGSGLQGVKYVEFEYSLGAHRWIPVQRTEWLTDTDAMSDYPWHLVPTYGMRYMQAWVADNAGNISLEPGTDVIGFLPTKQADEVGRYGVVFYRILLEEGENLDVTLTPLKGDPDLYIWGPNGQLWHSNSYTGIENVSLEAPVKGTYQIEIHGFTDASYQLAFEERTFARKNLWPSFHHDLQVGPKPLPKEETTPLDEWPEFYDVEAPPIVDNTLYLPITTR